MYWFSIIFPCPSVLTAQPCQLVSNESERKDITSWLGLVTVLYSNTYMNIIICVLSLACLLANAYLHSCLRSGLVHMNI